MAKKLSLKDLSVKGSKVLMRVDFNVPLDKSGKITDDSRIVATLPSIRMILDRGGAVILMSHLGRPDGKKMPEFTLAPCAKHLSQLLGKPVLMAPDCVGPEVEKMAKALHPGDVMLLENLRYYAAEEKPDKDPNFAKQLAALGDCYVNDAFGTAHRAHASTFTVASYFPGKAAAGLLMEKEIHFLGDMLANPKRPFYAIIGGKKISGKIEVLESLMKKVDGLLIGGGMVYTFAKAQGMSIGQSICEDEQLETARNVMKACKERNVKLWLGEDVVAADDFNNDAKTQVVRLSDGIPDGYQGMDIGPATIKKFSDVLKDAATVLWNGPLGVFEMSHFAAGTKAIATLLAKLKATTIVGGGDSLAAVAAAGVADKLSHLSTGGGASLEYIEKGKLPGIEALSDA